MSENKGWEPSTTGGEVISLQRAAEIFGISSVYLRQIMLKIGLRPATPFNPRKQRQKVSFYLADVQVLAEKAEPLINASLGEDEKKAVSVVAA